MIWSRCPKNKYASPQSFRISSAIAILVFNEGELTLYGIMHDLGLFPSRRVYQSILDREQKLQSSRISQAKSNFQRRRRRLRLAKQSREKALLKSEGAENKQGKNVGLFQSEEERKEVLEV